MLHFLNIFTSAKNMENKSVLVYGKTIGLGGLVWKLKPKPYEKNRKNHFSPCSEKFFLMFQKQFCCIFLPSPSSIGTEGHLKFSPWSCEINECFTSHPDGSTFSVAKVCYHLVLRLENLKLFLTRYFLGQCYTIFGHSFTPFVFSTNKFQTLSNFIWCFDFLSKKINLKFFLGLLINRPTICKTPKTI